jgi:glycine cleavage system H protein
MAEEFIETTVDKFTFRIKRGCWYSAAGVWIEAEGNLGRVGLSDFLQQQSGDVAFVDVRPVGTALAVGDEFASVETMKVDLALDSPVSGAIAEVNEALKESPELVNQDPYGEGWLAVVELGNWEADRRALLDAEQYLEAMRAQALEEMGGT